jgi:hypothetical protein
MKQYTINVQRAIIMDQPKKKRFSWGKTAKVKVNCPD